MPKCFDTKSKKDILADYDNKSNTKGRQLLKKGFTYNSKMKINESPSKFNNQRGRKISLIKEESENSKINLAFEGVKVGYLKCTLTAIL